MTRSEPGRQSAGPATGDAAGSAGAGGALAASSPAVAELKRDDRRLLAPQFARLARDARSVADLVDDLWPLELREPGS